MSTAETEHASLSQSLREVIPIMNLLNKFKSKGLKIFVTTPSIICTALEDNNGVIELENIPKISNRIEHINLVYHHFRK